MYQITLKKQELNKKDWVKHPVSRETEGQLIIKTPARLLREDGSIIATVLEASDFTESIVSQLKKTKFATSDRSRGLVSTSRIFGFRPRLEMRADFCAPCSVNRESAELNFRMSGLAQVAEQYYMDADLSLYERHRETVKQVLPEWRINQSIFTQAIINKNNLLKYHYDSGNFPGLDSVMFVFKDQCVGGDLHLPEYGVIVELPNRSVLVFDGQSVLHGVTPFHLTGNGYRYSIVFYALRKMKDCFSPAKELDRIRKKKMQRERIRHTMPEEHRNFLKSRYKKQ